MVLIDQIVCCGFVAILVLKVEIFVTHACLSRKLIMYVSALLSWSKREENHQVYTYRPQIPVGIFHSQLCMLILKSTQAMQT